VSAQEQNTGTTAVRAAHRFDSVCLDRWMQRNVPGYRGPLSVEQFRGGQSNPTYKLTTPTACFVLRRKPPGTLLKGAHAVEREFQVLEALGRVEFPVARVHALCTDESVVGTAFYVMEFVAGRVFWDATLPNVAREERARYFDAMNETLARLHRIDYVTLGLSDYGKPGNYFARQIARWSRQYVDEPAAGRDAHLDQLLEWLPRNIPPGEESAIVHGDCRFDNLIFHPTEPRVLAVLDWELSTLGHPLADVSYSALMYRLPPAMIAGLVGADLAALGIPSEEDYLAAYCRRTGRAGIPRYDFYVAFNLFRLAAIMHGIRGRVVRGTASSDHAREMAASLELFSRLGWQAAERAMRTAG